MNRPIWFFAVLGLGLCRLGLAAQGTEGRLVAAGPAWAVDVASFTSHKPHVPSVSQPTVEAVYVPVNARWTTYVIRDSDTTYICREKDSAAERIPVAGERVIFHVKGSHLSWKTAAGQKHTSHLVSR